MDIMGIMDITGITGTLGEDTWELFNVAAFMYICQSEAERGREEDRGIGTTTVGWAGS